MEHGARMCKPLPGITCYGSQEEFPKPGFPCVKYNGHYFLSTLLFSIFLGFLGIDRFCLGHTGTGDQRYYFKYVDDKLIAKVISTIETLFSRGGKTIDFGWSWDLVDC